MRILQLFAKLKAKGVEARIRSTQAGDLEIEMVKRAHGMQFSRSRIFDKKLLARAFEVEAAIYSGVGGLIEEIDGA